jgi:hypothetical protein
VQSEDVVFLSSITWTSAKTTSIDGKGGTVPASVLPVAMRTMRTEMKTSCVFVDIHSSLTFGSSGAHHLFFFSPFVKKYAHAYKRNCIMNAYIYGSKDD